MVLIIPVGVNAEMELSFPMMGDGVMLIEDGHKVLRMLFSSIVYSKSVNSKHEADWASGMCPETGGKSVFSPFFNSFCANITD